MIFAYEFVPAVQGSQVMERNGIYMKKKFTLENLDCANCAAKMENSIKKIPGVIDASISFMTMKLVLEAEDDVFEEVLALAAKECARVEPDCKIIIK